MDFVYVILTDGPNMRYLVSIMMSGHMMYDVTIDVINPPYYVSKIIILPYGPISKSPIAVN